VSLKIDLKSIQTTLTTFTFQPAPPLANNDLRLKDVGAFEAQIIF
jgi:hypothetical protein